MKTRRQNAHPIVFATGMGLLVAASLLAATGKVSSFEETIFRAIHDMPAWLRLFALTVTQFGSAWVLLGLVGLLFIVRKSPRLALVVLGSGVTTYGLVEIAKRLIDRPRPAAILGGVTQRESVLQELGFPSGHTALAAAVGLILWSFLPKKWRWVVVAWIALVAWSRVYLGVHLPLDVVGGFCLGIVVATVVKWYLQSTPHKRKLKAEV